MAQRDPVEAFDACLAVAFGGGNVRKVSNGVPIWKVREKRGDHEVTFKEQGQLPRGASPVALEYQVTVSDGKGGTEKVARMVIFPPCLEKLRLVRQGNTVLARATIHYHLPRGALLPDIFAAVYLAGPPERPFVVHVGSESCEVFRDFRAELTARATATVDDSFFANLYGEAMLKMGH